MLKAEEKNIIFEELFNHFVKENHLPSKTYEVLKQFLMLIISGSGSYNYALPAIRYAQFDDAILISKNPVHSVIGTCVPAVAVLYVATDMFLDFHFRGKVPQQFRDFLALPESRKQRIFNNFCIFIGAFLSAIPLATTYLTYENNSIPVAVLLSTMIQLDNTVLHFLPIKLMLSQPLYRWPILPVEYLIYALKYCLTSQTKLDRDKRKTQLTNVINGLTAALNGKLTAGTENIIHSLLQFRPFRLDYKVTLPENFDNLSLETILEKAPKIIPSKSKFHKVCDSSAFLFGSSWLIFGTVGYLANAFTLMDGILDNMSLSIGLTAMPIYALAVLVVFLAGNMMRDNFNWVLTAFKGQQNLALEIKLYPKTFMLLELFNIYCACFSYAAAAQMIEDNFTESTWKDALPFFIWSAITGIIFLGCNAVHGAYETLLRKYTLHFGSPDAKALVQLQEKVVQLTTANTLIKPEVAKAQIEDLSFTDALSQTFFGQPKAAVVLQLNQANELPAQPSFFQRVRNALCCSPTSTAEETKPLIQNIP